MNYKVSQNHIKELIQKYLDTMFDISNIHWTHPIEINDEGEDYEDPYRIEFYLGDYGEQNIIFMWYDKDYWGTSWKNYKSNSPLLVVEKPYLNTLNGLFGTHWYEPFKDWFKENLGIPVNKIIDELS